MPKTWQIYALRRFYNYIGRQQGIVMTSENFSKVGANPQIYQTDKSKYQADYSNAVNLNTENVTPSFKAQGDSFSLNVATNKLGIDKSLAPSPQPSPLKGEGAHGNSYPIHERLKKAKRDNGLVEKFYDFLKNKTGFGIGSNSVEQTIKQAEQSKISQKEAEKKLAAYKNSQENAAQNFGDLASGAVAITGYFALTNTVKRIRAQMELKAFHPILEGFRPLLEKAPKDTVAKLKSFIKSNNKTKALIIPMVMLTGGITKYWLLKFNRIGSKEFKVENKDGLSKKELKKAERKLNRKRHKENFRNFYTGALSGLLAPVLTLAGGIAGIPAYLLATTGIRFGTRKDKKHNKTSFVDSLKNNIALNTVFAAAIAIPAWRKVKYSKILSANLDKVVKNLKGVKLEKPNLPSNKTAYSEIEDILLNSDEIKAIMHSGDTVDEKILQLTEQNLFAVKFLQIQRGGSELSSALIENCPSSRTMSEAQEEINRLVGSKQYKARKLLGVGTVAETYLVKEKATGKEVCIKILKKGINAEKIQRDKEAFIKLVMKDKPEELLSKNQEYLIRNIENFAEALMKEIDFVNEMKAAQKLRKSTKQANVVSPIKAGPGYYIMEKAPGISLDTLVKYYQQEIGISYIKSYAKQGYFTREEADKAIAECQKRIQKLKAKSPDFKDFELSQSEIQKLLNKYIDVYTEQFVKVDKHGKTLHADIHPGNIFINLEALKTGKGKIFTLIDTGNTIDLAKEQAISAIRFSSYIKRGNVKDIARYVLDGAELPEKLTRAKAQQLVEKDLREIFFDGKTKINSMNAEEVLRLANNILRKHRIIPNDTQLNLNKAKISARNSLHGLADSFFGKKLAEMVGIKSKKEAVIESAKVTKDLGLLLAKSQASNTKQETLNLFRMSAEEALRQFRNPNMLATNSEEYLTYRFKQHIRVETKQHAFD